MGLDELHLRVLATSSEDPIEQRNAKKVLQLMTKGRHWVLVVRPVHGSYFSPTNNGEF